jgi:hypothetical protein
MLASVLRLIGLDKAQKAFKLALEEKAHEAVNDVKGVVVQMVVVAALAVAAPLALGIFRTRSLRRHRLYFFVDRRLHFARSNGQTWLWLMIFDHPAPPRGRRCVPLGLRLR